MLKRTSVFGNSSYADRKQMARRPPQDTLFWLESRSKTTERPHFPTEKVGLWSRKVVLEHRDASLKAARVPSRMGGPLAPYGNILACPAEPFSNFPDRDFGGGLEKWAGSGTRDSGSSGPPRTRGFCEACLPTSGAQDPGQGQNLVARSQIPQPCPDLSG